MPFFSQPVAVRRSPLQSPPSTLISSPLPSITPPISPSPRPPFFSQLRIPSPLFLSPRSTLPPPGQGHSPLGSPALSSTRSPPPAIPASPNPSTRTEKDAATLAICVLVAMPDASAPMHRPISNIKGKGVDPVEVPESRVSGDADPLLPSSRRRSRARIPKSAVKNEGLPLLEFGVVDITTGDRWGP